MIASPYINTYIIWVYDAIISYLYLQNALKNVLLPRKRTSIYVFQANSELDFRH